MLVSNLSADSALARALDPTHGVWSQTDELLATNIEVVSAKLDIVASFVHGLARMFATGGSRSYDPHPVEIPRPEHIEELRRNDPQKVRKQSSMGEVAAFLRNAASNVA